MRSSSAWRRRRGQLIPVIGVVLIIFGFMAVSYMFHQQTVSSVTGIATYGHKARFLALAVAEEAGLFLHEQFDELRGDAPLKKQLIDTLKGQEDGTTVELDLGDIAGSLSESVALVQGTANAELLGVTVKIHGFHRLNYASTDMFDNPDAIYHSEPFDDLNDPEDPTKVQGPEDWIGFATIQARVAMRGVERQVQVTHDLKIVDTTPIAREFAYMAYKPLDQSQQALTLETLNKGGYMSIWPNEVGRIMMRGPYVIVSEGEADATGGEKRSGKMRQNKSYPKSGRRWYGWAAVPGLRALRWNKLAWPWGNNIRPKDDGINPIGVLRLPSVEFVTLLVNDHAFDCPSANYFCAATDVGGQKFSIWGEPGNGGVEMPPAADGNPPNNGWSMFRGPKMKYSKEGKQSFQGVHESGQALGGGDNGDAIEPEGFGLFGVFKKAEHNNIAKLLFCIYLNPVCCPPVPNIDTWHIWCLPIPGCIGPALITLDAPRDIDPNNPQISGSDYIQVPYGLRYMEKESVPIWASLLEAAVSYVIAYAGGGTVGAAGAPIPVSSLAGGSFWSTAGNVFTLLGDQLYNSMLLSGATMVASAITGKLPTAADLAAAVPDGYFPPRYRHFIRGATRIHPTLEEALSADGASLNLDGIVMVEALPQDTQADFTYKGRGILFTGTSGEDNNKTPFLGDITPEDPTTDWMSFVHIVPRAPVADGGDCQVKLNSNKLEMSIFAEEGVTTETESALYGNLVVGIPNKHKIPDEATFRVFYNYERLAKNKFGGPPDSEWSDGTWKRVSVSPKVSGYYGRFR